MKRMLLMLTLLLIPLTAIAARDPYKSRKFVDSNGETQIICDQDKDGDEDGVRLSTPDADGNDCLPSDKTNNPIYTFLNRWMNIAIALLGGLSVLIIVASGIQYITSSGNPESVKAARSRLVNAVVGLVLLTLMYVVLGIILPDGTIL